MIAVAVFAHNEARHIVRCLRSVTAGAAEIDLRIYVLCNGSTDDTSTRVAGFAAENKRVSLIDIALGDKCNAWNVYIHDVAPQAEAYVFIDGDSELRPAAISRVLRTLRASPEANAVSGLPDAGRSAKEWRCQIIDNHALVGCLYALPSTFVERIRERRIRLPVGFVGDDSLVGSLAAWDLDPAGDWDAERRIVVCTDAEFRFDPVCIWSPRDLKRHARRLVRYSRRRYEVEMLNDILRSEGLPGMPRDTSELYRRRGHLCRLAWRGTWMPFDWLALKAIRSGGRRPL
jgi:glycosyltransferase involved in cell wall biosynthesis